MATFRKAQSSTKTHEGTPQAQRSAEGGPTPEKIAARAYAIWQESGRPEGKDEENWYRAERELGAQATPR